MSILNKLTHPIFKGFSLDELNYFLKVSKIVAFNENEILKDIIIYPNPTSGELSIRSYDFPLEYMIIDIYGREIKRGLITTLREISIAELSPGIYLLELLTLSGSGVKHIKKSLPFIVSNWNNY